jgi:hypothetical protein
MDVPNVLVCCLAAKVAAGVGRVNVRAVTAAATTGHDLR